MYHLAPTNTQSFNRYSYAFNNPLKFIDPTGWENMIYFVVAGNVNRNQVKAIVNRTNEVLKSNAINAEAKFSSKLNLSKLDPTDKIVIIGESKKTVSNYVGKNLSKVSDGTLDNWKQGDRNGVNPERSENPKPNGGNKLIGLDMKDMEKATEQSYSKNIIDNSTFTVMHGLGHNAGFGHDEAMFMNSEGFGGSENKFSVNSMLSGTSSQKEARNDYVTKVNEMFTEGCPKDNQ